MHARFCFFRERSVQALSPVTVELGRVGGDYLQEIEHESLHRRAVESVPDLRRRQDIDLAKTKEFGGQAKTRDLQSTLRSVPRVRCVI